MTDRSAKLYALARTIDPERARGIEERLGQKLAGVALALGTLLATAYPALSAVIEADPDDVTSVAAEKLRAPRDRAGLLARLSTAAGDPRDADRFLRSLRRAARTERLRIAARELLPPSLGGADVDVTAREIAALAEATIELALLEAVSSVTERLGVPRTASGASARFVVLGMGKLGGDELNAGSDVDLIYLYDTDDGEAEAKGGEKTSLHEVWTRVARRLTASLEEATEEGRLWRVDLRLRPEGTAGPLVNSLAATERYYESFGRLWERAALLRARPVAGDLALGEEALAALEPFIWRRRVDPTIAVEMTALTRRARAELTRGGDHDLKLGRGGIREAEFFVQTLALIWGGREPRVRAKGTLGALRRLRATGLVTDREGREIADAYLALRRAEHAVQTATGLQTHSLPAVQADLARLARSLGFTDSAPFLADLAKHQGRVERRFASLLPEGELAASRFNEVLSALDRSDVTALADALTTAGVAAVDMPSLARDLFELSRRPDAPLGARARESFPGLALALLEAVGDAADPEQAARALRMFFARVGQPGVYARILGGDPSAVRRLVAALGASAFIGDAVAHNPELGDLVLFAHPLPTQAVAREEVLAAARDVKSDDEDEDEALVGALRKAKARITVEVGLADLAGEIGTRDATLILSSLADASLEVATRRALGTQPDAEVRGLAVLAMGKLGGREIGYGSDLDVVFLFDPAAAPEGIDATKHFTRAARRVIRLITISHPAGPGYELDTRLRPSGNQGLLVVSIDAFARYHDAGAEEAGGPGVRAATWERMALLRARAAAGDPLVGAEAMRIATRTAYERGGDARGMAEEVHRLRLRMERELSHERPGRYDLKLGRGGLADVELAVQLLQLCHGARLAVRTQETPLAIEALAAEGILSPEQAEALREGYAFLRRLEQRIRVVHADAAHLVEESAPGLAPLARRMGIRDRPRGEAAAELLARYREVTERVRAVYEAIVVARSAA